MIRPSAIIGSTRRLGRPGGRSRGLLGRAVLLALFGATLLPAAPEEGKKADPPPPARRIQLSPAADPLPAAGAGDPAVLHEIIPPLSIYDSCLLLKRAVELLGRAEGRSSPTTVLAAGRILQVVGQYVERIDAAHPTLPEYSWEGVSAEKAPSAGWETQVFRLEKPLREVTAVQLNAHHGRVECSRIVVIDQDRTEWEFNQSLTIQSDQPRPEVFFLPLPTTLVEVRITCRRRDAPDSRRPRLFVQAGICALPESGKQAVYHLRVARHFLAGYDLPAAAKAIRRAYEQLESFQRSRRL